MHEELRVPFVVGIAGIDKFTRDKCRYNGQEENKLTHPIRRSLARLHRPHFVKLQDLRHGIKIGQVRHTGSPLHLERLDRLRMRRLPHHLHMLLSQFNTYYDHPDRSCPQDLQSCPVQIP